MDLTFHVVLHMNEVGELRSHLGHPFFQAAVRGAQDDPGPPGIGQLLKEFVLVLLPWPTDRSDVIKSMPVYMEIYLWPRRIEDHQRTLRASTQHFVLCDAHHGRVRRIGEDPVVLAYQDQRGRGRDGQHARGRKHHPFRCVPEA